MSVDDFAAMVLLTSFQVDVASLNKMEFDMTDASLDYFNLEDCYRNQVLSNVWPFVCNEILQTAVPVRKYCPSDAVIKVTQVYKDSNGNTTWLTIQMYLNNIFLQCRCINAFKYDIDVLHHAVTHLDPYILTEAKFNYSGHLNKIPWGNLSQTCALQKLLVVTRQAKVKVCGMRNLISRQTIQYLLVDNTDPVGPVEGLTTAAANSAAAASSSGSTISSTST